MTQSMGDVIQRAAASKLVGFSRAADLEEDKRAICYEDATKRLLVRFELGRPRDHLWIVIISYEVRPALSEMLDRGTRREHFRAAEIGPLPVVTESDRERVTRWVSHIASSHELIDFDDPFLDRFLGAVELDEIDFALGVKTVRRELSAAVLGLRGDVAKSDLPLPIGRVFVEHDPGYVSPRGPVPPFVRLALDGARRASPTDWFHANTTGFVPGLYMSRHARGRIIEQVFTDAQRELDQGRAWTLAEDTERNLSIRVQIQGDRIQPQPTREYVVYINRDRPEFIRLLNEQGDAEWQAIYFRSDVASDAESVLEMEIAKDPLQFDGYRTLADYYSRSGDEARSNLTLGLGYLRAKRLLGIAKGKFEIAAKLDPTLPGLAKALEELRTTTR